MRKLGVVLAVGVAFAAGAAYADTIENAYSNTIVVTPAGSDAGARYLFEADGTFTMTAPDGSAVNGAYAVNGDQICLTPEGGEQGCTTYVGDKNVGDSWTQTGIDGSEITVTLEAGR
jgi:hypothetical protein